jgi:uncharacterized membrane protein YcaP (DUF421 family)
MAEILDLIFGGATREQSLLLPQIAARALAVYLIGLALVRIGKSRMIGRATPLDVLVGFMIGALLSRGILGESSLVGTVAACAALVAAHWVLTWLTWRWHWIGMLIKGNIELIVRDGQMQIDAMRHSHISKHDLQEQMRLRGTDDLAQVKLAYKERNGEISVIRAENPPKIVEVAVRDGVQIVRIEVS